MAVAIVAALFLTMFAYSSNWPPLVVIESRSMQHADGESFVGIMDTGDLVIVKKALSRTDIKTYFDGRQADYKSYGDYGDVIVYLRGGSNQQTPIIHRAVMYLEANPDGVSFSSWELGQLTEGVDFDFSVSTDTWIRITGNVLLHDFGFRSEELVIPIADIILEAKTRSIPIHSGFITKGDFNRQVDQFLGISPNKEPVRLDWVVGMARGELPWLGIIKLFLTGGLPDYTPQNSIYALMIVIIVVIVIPLTIEIVLWLRQRRQPSGSEKTRRPPGS
ncbi:MAG: S26 family signal peptidase [Thermoplasmata archaeon]